MALDTLPNNIPEPVDDGAADHLEGMKLPRVELIGTDGAIVDLSMLSGVVVVYLYPMTGVPGVPLPDGWDEIPGARGCTPQSCSFRDHMAELQALGVTSVFGISTQTSDYQREAAERLHLPFSLLSDAELKFQEALNLPVLEVALPDENNRLLKRMALVARDGVIEKVFYPVFPPDRNAADVLDWLKTHSTN